jgi:hypothetical protein
MTQQQYHETIEMRNEINKQHYITMLTATIDADSMVDAMWESSLSDVARGLK